jgi:beta-glucanase (GH16 family)
MFMTAFLDPIRVGISRQKTFGMALASLSVIVGLMATGGMAQAANVLSNPGFETGGLGGWTTFGVNNSVLSTGGHAHSGTYYYKVYGQFSTSHNYTGIYQITNSAPGAIYSADGWAYSLSSDVIKGQNQAWIEVSFRDSSYNALALYRSLVVTTNNIASLGVSTWFDLQVTNQCSYTNATALVLLPGTVTNTATSLVAPANTAYVFYQIVFSQVTNSDGGSMYFDDLTLNQTGGTAVAPPATEWNIVWSDEFNGTFINPNVWTLETGYNGGWGNSELEDYTTSSQNAYVSNGFLHIVALQANGGTTYTSARMKTQNNFTTTYGRIVWRAALPAGVGMWPALWMLGADYPSVGWPGCGEIDVVEENGSNPTNAQSSLHSGSDETGIYNFPIGQSATNFHTYMVDWEPYSTIKFYVDSNLFETQTGWYDASGPFPTPFNAPFYLVMNLAVGGTYVGRPNTNNINTNTVFPATLLVDYVRVYQQTAPLALSVAPQPDGSTVLTWPTNIVCHVQVQTNVLTGTNWFDTSVTTSPFVISPDPNNNCVFYRLASP